MIEFIDTGNPWFWASLALACLAAEIAIGSFYSLSAAIALCLVALVVLIVGPEAARDWIWHILGIASVVWLITTKALRRFMKPAGRVVAQSDPNEL